MHTPGWFQHFLLPLCLVPFVPLAHGGDAAVPHSLPIAEAWLLASAGKDGDGLHLAYSTDGTDWTDLDRVFLKPPAGAGEMHDPRVSRDAEGLFHLVWSAATAAPGGEPSPTRAYRTSTRDFERFTTPEAFQDTDRDTTPEAPAVEGRPQGCIFAAPAELVEKLRRESASIAPPPSLEGFTADPGIRAFGDAYYIYPTSDRPFWNTTEFAVWSSKNLVDWKKEGVVMDLSKNDVVWADLQAWAPDCIERDGTYYLYFCGRGKIGVATAPTPIGPFKDALGRPLLERGGKIKTNTIDPYPFIDDDGQAWLYYGNGDLCQAIRLKPDMITLDGDPVDIPLAEFREGIVVFKRAGKYYFMWSIDDARSPDYRVGWGVADSATGPVVSPKENFIVLRKNGPVKGTAHHSVVNVPGTDRWYAAYHRHAVPGGGGYKRETCLVRMEFSPDGAILPMDPMKPAFTLGDTGEPLIDGRGRP